MSYDLETHATTGSTVYVIIRNSTAQVWSVHDTAFVTWADAHYSYYPVSMTEQGTSGFFYASMPAGINTAGWLAVEFYIGAGSEGDTFLTGGSLYWTGSSVGNLDTGTALTSLTYVKILGNITVGTYDTFLQSRIYAISKAIESYCRRVFAQQAYTATVDGAGSTELLLPEYPVAGLTQVVVGVNDVSPVTIPAGSLIVNNKTGILVVNRTSTYSPWFPYGFQNVQVEYTAGYSPIPSDLQEACAEMVLNAYLKIGQDVTLSMEKIGDYQRISRADVQKLITDDIKETLDRYKQSIV